MGYRLNTDIYGVPDEENPEITPEEFAQAKPFAEMFPELAEKMRQARDSQRMPVSASRKDIGSEEK